jgi:hypothetical protein
VVDAQYFCKHLKFKTMNKTAFLRRAQVVEWLKEEGFLQNQIRIMFETGAIVSLKLPGNENGRSLYSRAQIERDVLGKLQGV